MLANNHSAVLMLSCCSLLPSSDGNKHQHDFKRVPFIAAHPYPRVTRGAVAEAMQKYRRPILQRKATLLKGNGGERGGVGLRSPFSPRWYGTLPSLVPILVAPRTFPSAAFTEAKEEGSAERAYAHSAPLLPARGATPPTGPPSPAGRFQPRSFALTPPSLPDPKAA